MAKSDSPVKVPANGFIIGRTELGDFREIFSAPPEEQDTLFKAYIRQKLADAEERALQRVEAILDEAMFGPE